MPRVNMWGLSLYCCDSLKCYTAEQRLLTLGNQSCSQLPAGQTRKRGLLPRSGGMSSPFDRGSSQFGRRRWRRLPPWPWEGPFLQTAAIRQAKTVCLCVLTSVSSCCIHNHIRCILVWSLHELPFNALLLHSCPSTWIHTNNRTGGTSHEPP